MKKLLPLILALFTVVSSAQTGSASVTLKNVATHSSVDSLKDDLAQAKQLYEAQIATVFNRLDSLVKSFDQDPKGIFKRYPIIPSSAFTTGTALVPSNFCCGTLANGTYNFETGRNPGDYKLAGLFTGGLSLRQADGTAGHIYRFVNTAGDVYGTTGTGQHHGISTTNSGNYLYFSGLDPDHPMIVTGENGMQLPAGTVASGGAHLGVQNVIAYHTNASGLTANFDEVSGSYYQQEDYYYYRVDSAGQEGLYVGATHLGGAKHHNVNVSQFFARKTQREGLQFSETYNLNVHNVTVFDAGQTATAGQRNAAQFHELHGIFSKFVLVRAPFPFNIFAHGFTIKDGYVEFTEGYGYIGDYTTQPAFVGSVFFNGDTLVIDGLYAKYTGAGTLPYLFLVDEKIAPVIARNCHLSGNITKIFQDNNAIATNPIIGNVGDHGNVTDNTMTTPVMVPDYANSHKPKTFGLQAVTSWAWIKGWGFMALNSN